MARGPWRWGRHWACEPSESHHVTILTRDTRPLSLLINWTWLNWYNYTWLYMNYIVIHFKVSTLACEQNKAYRATLLALSTINLKIGKHRAVPSFSTTSERKCTVTRHNTVNAQKHTQPGYKTSQKVSMQTTNTCSRLWFPVLSQNAY